MRKLFACLVLTGASLLATTPASTESLPCSYLCCNEWDPAAECTWFPYGVTDCQTWWGSGNYCP
jgi:hypothetical protein